MGLVKAADLSEDYVIIIIIIIVIVIVIIMLMDVGKMQMF